MADRNRVKSSQPNSVVYVRCRMRKYGLNMNSIYVPFKALTLTYYYTYSRVCLYDINTISMGFASLSKLSWQVSSLSFNRLNPVTSSCLVPCQSLCQLHLGMRLFVFINIFCFFCVFIIMVLSCICQLEWKARDTTESGSRLNHFHAISTTFWGVCLPLGEERLSHTEGDGEGSFCRAAAATQPWRS